MLDNQELLDGLKIHIDATWAPHKLFLEGNGRPPASERLGRLEWVAIAICAVGLASVGAVVAWGLGYIG